MSETSFTFTIDGIEIKASTPSEASAPWTVRSGALRVASARSAGFSICFPGFARAVPISTPRLFRDRLSAF